ncbi:MAG: DUF423 domain-containing protein [Deltaproteobacteria bacterium]
MIATGALLMALGVILGAFGAHGLEGKITPEKIEVFKTGVQYHLVHALGILLLGVFAAQLREPAGLLTAAFWCLLVGILLFSGSIYALALGGPRWLGPVTPLGGLSFIVGWTLFAWVALKTS